MEEILELQGYLVTTASHGQHALDLLRSGEHPQLILLDLMMPVMNGAEFLVEMRADPGLQHIPVLLVTAFSDRAKDLPAQHVLGKPVDFPSFFRLLAKFTTEAEP